MAKTKKLKFKFIAKAQDGRGEVVISGLGEDEEFPEQVQKLLENYGFSDDIVEAGEGSVSFTDSCCPGECSVEEDIECISQIVNMELHSYLQRKKNGEVKVTFTCCFDECRTGKDATIDGALQAAHSIWNKAGRPIDGVTVKEELEELLLELNEKRV